MKQLFQNLRTGSVDIEDIPVPASRPGFLVIQSQRSLVSLGTERMLLEFGKAGWISKALQQPDKVAQVIQKIKTDGLQPTIKSVFNKLNQPLPLGYNNAGVVVEVGKNVEGFEPGDRVVSNGPHAEFVCAPVNLCAKIPGNVSSSDASFTVLGAIGLQGIRLLHPTLGENIAVIGLGLIGLLSCQILKANGCEVIGFDFDQNKVDIAAAYGVKSYNLTEEIDPVQAAIEFSGGVGVDGVLITASTSSNRPIDDAPKMCRRRGRVVLIGVTGLQLNRTEFYRKEISFQVSCSYGPGRYDEAYEAKGMDYPIGFVRWTEQRNFQAVLQLMANKQLILNDLVSTEVDFRSSVETYQKMEPGTLGVLFKYDEKPDTHNTIALRDLQKKTSGTKVKIGVIGAGSYVGSMLLPALSKTPAEMVAIASSGGASGTRLGRAYKFDYSTTDKTKVFADQTVNAIVIGTRHDSHASLVVDVLRSGKHVFAEKPLALSIEELQSIKSVYQSHRNQCLMVGFNRRFSPLTVKMKQLLKNKASPLTMVMTVNAGMIPKSHWTQDQSVGGGRIIGEACHFIDLLVYLTGGMITEVSAFQVSQSGDQPCEDKMSILLKFNEGSIGTIHYFANGHKSVSKERCEVFCDGRILQLDNFKVLKGFGYQHFKKKKLASQDKGQENMIKQFVEAVQTGQDFPISFQELENVTLTSFAAIESVASKQIISI